MNLLKLNFKILIFIFFLTNIAYSTSGDNDTLKALNIVKKINYNSAQIKKVELEGEIEYENTETGNSGSLFAVISKPDSCYAKIKGTFGITGVIMLITKNEFTYYNVMENIVIKGPPSEKNLGIILRVNISYDNLINIFSGSFILSDTLKKGNSYSFTKSFLIITEIDSLNLRKEYWIDTSKTVVTKIKSYNDSGKVDYEINFSKYKNINGIKFPVEIDFKRELKREYLWIKYTDVNFEVENFNYKINIPKSAKIYNWN